MPSPYRDLFDIPGDVVYLNAASLALINRIGPAAIVAHTRDIDRAITALRRVLL